MTNKISIEEVKKIHPKILLKIINRAKKFLKKNEVMKEMCDKYNVDVDILDIVPIRFGDIEVSARTDHGIITLNYKLLCDGDFFKDYQYIIHEFQHFLDQTLKSKPTKGADDGNYLDNPDEQKSFQRQLQYVDDQYGTNEVNKYVDHLLDHHDIKNKKDREDKKEVLTELV